MTKTHSERKGESKLAGLNKSVSTPFPEKTKGRTEDGVLSILLYLLAVIVQWVLITAYASSEETTRRYVFLILSALWLGIFFNREVVKGVYENNKRNN